MPRRIAQRWRTGLGFLVAPLTVPLMLGAYGAATGAAVTAGFVMFCTAIGYAAALVLGLPLHVFVLEKRGRRGAGTYLLAGGGVGLAAYAAIAAVLSIHAIVTLAIDQVLYFLWLTRHFAAVGAVCGAASALVFWVAAVRGRDGV